MAQTPHPTVQQKPPLAEDIRVKDAFADDCAGVAFVHGTIHLTFTSTTADHSRDPAPSKRIVSARLVLTPNAMMELADLLAKMTAALTAQGIIQTATPRGNPT
jgi:hypothetical protein